MLPHQQSEFYVYVHRRSDTRQVFYVGKGIGRRATSFRNRLPDWHAARADCDVLVEVVAHSMSDKEARALEAALIDFIIATGGRLANKALTKQRAPKSTKPSKPAKPAKAVKPPKLPKPAKPPRDVRAYNREYARKRRRGSSVSVDNPIVCLSTQRTFRDAHAVLRWAKSNGIGAIAPITIARMAATDGVFAGQRWRAVTIA